MVTYKAYKLHFTTPVHFGSNRDDYSVSQQTLQSDTMYAALTSCLSKLGCGIPDGGDLGCTISSLFPYYQRGEGDAPVYFLPKPKAGHTLGEADIESRKKIKKVEWLDPDHFERAISGNAYIGGGELDNIHGKFLSTQPVPATFVSSRVQERVQVSRTWSEDAKPYSLDRVTFADQSGLYFLAEGDTTLIDKALTLLQHEGIGTDRAVGNGLFTYTTDTLTLRTPADGNSQMALSVYIPASEQELEAMLASDLVAYDLTRRGGWITTPPFGTLRKNRVHAFLPASLFAPHAMAAAKGAIVDLGKGVPGLTHPIYRCGRSLFIPVKQQAQ